MGNFIQDARYSLRILVKNPGLPALAVLTLALGIAANSTIFSWINSTLLNPIPGIARTNDLVTVMRGDQTEHPTPPFSYPDYRDLRGNNRSFSGLLAYHHEYASLTGSGKPERIYAVLTSANYFDVLGVRPILGRGFVPEEERPVEGSAAVAVISYDLWQSHFGGDRSIIDRRIEINRYPYTVVGIAPPGFQGCMTGLRGDVWIPWVMARQVWGFGGTLDDRGDSWLNVLGKLRPGTDSRQAEGELNLLMQRIAQRFPDQHQGPNQITLDPLWRSPFGANVYFYATLPLLLGLAAMLLLLACANVANLLLVRSITRRREIAIRLSIGASRWRLVRELMVESLLLGLAGGAVALLLTTWAGGDVRRFHSYHDSPPKSAWCVPRSHRSSGDLSGLDPHRGGFRRAAGSALLRYSPGRGAEGRGGEHLRRTPQVAVGERAGGGADRPFRAPAGLCGPFRPQPRERRASGSGLRPGPRATGVL
jgi:predicted permease